MSLTIIEQIAQELQSRLEAMIDNTAYTTTVLRVVRPRRLDDFTPFSGTIVLMQGDAEMLPDLSYPGNPPAVATRQTFNISCYIANDEKNADEIDALVNQFAAEVKVAVCTPVANWYQFDAKAIDAEWLAPQQMTGEGGIDGVVLPIAITYRTDENNPFNLRG